MSSKYIARQPGRRPKLSPDKELALVKMYGEKEVPVEQIAVAFGVTKPTVYNILRRHGLRPNGAAA